MFFPVDKHAAEKKMPVSGETAAGTNGALLQITKTSQLFVQ